MTKDTETNPSNDTNSESFTVFEKRARAARQELKMVSEQRLSDVMYGIEKLDKLLLWTDRLLYASQPPTTGRIRIMWRRREEESNQYRPRLVKWIKLGGTKNGRCRWRYRVLLRPTKAVRAKGGFSTHRDEVLDLIEIAQELIEHRKTLVGYITNFSRGWTQKDQHLSDREQAIIYDLAAILGSINEKGVMQLDPKEVFG
ncbi:hypothetical protein [Allochromatium tepidum]|uniref:Uncharacterized protein n=1 Tax=Allochromatium tepidum TaxID=553982 RepID=A0ABN6GK40_9GAMM|nr:hypothetical protein [Allochromatium tepidum]BCU08341.1 hypothetical protein Atep_30180 [Allochromatium tepidum]